MNSAQNPSTQSSALNNLQRYHDNFALHLMGVRNHMENEVIGRFARKGSHKNLRLGYSSYIALIGHRSMRLTELAKILGISRQACNKTANLIVKAGYIKRVDDPNDARAKLMVLTSKGKKLREDGLAALMELDHQFVSLLGHTPIADASHSLRAIHTRLSPGMENDGDIPVHENTIGIFLPSLSDYILQQTFRLTQEKGHPHIKVSFAKV
ncbi:MAG: MarR family winged helix-turn-helix transcriptional regulator, partial [Halioglobus sp.]